MARASLEKSRKYICCEQFTGKYVQGYLAITDENIKVRLVSFDEYFHVENEQDYLSLRLEDNSYASLHRAHFGGAGSCSSRTEVTYSETVTATTLVHGPDEWKPEDPIRHVSFELPRADALLRYAPKIKELESNSPWKKIGTDVFTVDLPHVKIWLGYRGTISMRSERLSIDAPVIAVDFKEPRSIKSYLDDVQSIVRFVSLILGIQMEPQDIHIRRLSEEDMHAQVSKGDFLGDHAVTQMWFRKSLPDDAGSRVHYAFATLFDQEEMLAFSACLQAWIEREPDWARSNALMMDCLRLQKEISAERLLAACKWLEEIPIGRAIQVTDDSVIKSIAHTALEAARKFGQEQLKARISQALSRLSLESHRGRFDRLVNQLAERFGSGAVDSEMTDYLIAALRDFRGKVAHGHYEPKDEGEYHRFIKAIFAVEALCLLLTSLELPMTADAIRRIQSHPLMEHYHHFHIA